MTFIVLGVALVLWLLHALKGVLLLVGLAVFFAYLVTALVFLAGCGQMYWTRAD